MVALGTVPPCGTGLALTPPGEFEEVKTFSGADLIPEGACAVAEWSCWDPFRIGTFVVENSGPPHNSALGECPVLGSHDSPGHAGT